MNCYQFLHELINSELSKQNLHPVHFSLSSSFLLEFEFEFLARV